MTEAHSDARGDERFRPEDGCPLFSDRLEGHIVGVTRGEVPNHGRFCGHCYTPMSPDTSRCPHCGTEASARPAVERIPDEVVVMLRRQRKTERTWVTGFAYLGLLIAVCGGLAIVLGIPYLRAHLLPAAIVYGLVLFIGGRILAGVLGGYCGDRMGYERARAELRASWDGWLEERDRPRDAHVEAGAEGASVSRPGA